MNPSQANKKPGFVAPAFTRENKSFQYLISPVDKVFVLAVYLYIRRFSRSFNVYNRLFL
jgi:hypothetical protein